MDGLDNIKDWTGMTSELSTANSQHQRDCPLTGSLDDNLYIDGLTA